MPDWKPGASIEVLKLRSKLLQQTRLFFEERAVLEVETPLLASTTVTDVHLDSMTVASNPEANQDSAYLQTSPEFAMKRLLAAGVGACYQICKAFRRGEAGTRHNPEFTVIEWYRPGFSMVELMNEIVAYLRCLVDITELPRLTYRQIFQEQLGIDPHLENADRLQRLVQEKIDISPSASAELDSTDYLQLLLTHCIEPALPRDCFIYDFPCAQAALSRLEKDAEGQLVAKRFELYLGGMELANGYQELTDRSEQAVRFKADLKRRAELGLPLVKSDARLLAALANGLPQCSGVALGLDRLVMHLAGLKSIDQALAFSHDRC